MFPNEQQVNCVHCGAVITIVPPYTVAWEATSWVDCSNVNCKRPNKFKFLNGGNVSLVPVTKSNSTARLRISSTGGDKNLAELVDEAEDSNVHDRQRGSAIVLRVCLEKLIWVRTLGKPEDQVTVNNTVLTDLTTNLVSADVNSTNISIAETAFKYILDLGDTAAHYARRKGSTIIQPTRAAVDLAISYFDQLSQIVCGW